MMDEAIDWKARAEAAEAALAAAGEMRDAADRVSEWFCVEARHLEGPRIQGLRAAMAAYDKHMQPAAGMGAENALTIAPDPRDAQIAALVEALTPFALLEFDSTDEAWEAFYRASGHTWIDYDHIAATRAALAAVKGGE